MSISAIASSLFSNNQSIQNRLEARAPSLTGQNMQSSTPSDSVTLQASPNGSQSSNPLSQDYSQLAQDLQSGNLTAAQQDFTKIQQDLRGQEQDAPVATVGSHVHHRHMGKIGQLLQQVGQELQSGDLSGAQQTLTTLQQDLQQRHWAGGSSPEPVAASSVSVTA